MKLAGLVVAALGLVAVAPASAFIDQRGGGLGGDGPLEPSGNGNKEPQVAGVIGLPEAAHGVKEETTDFKVKFDKHFRRVEPRRTKQNTPPQAADTDGEFELYSVRPDSKTVARLVFSDPEAKRNEYANTPSVEALVPPAPGVSFLEAEAEAEAGTPQNKGPAWARVPKDETKKFPIATIGRTGLGCTGTLIAKRLVITAAHCLFSYEKKAWLSFDKATFSPGQDGSAADADKPFGTYKAVKMVVSGQYYKAGLTGKFDKYDWGLIVLEKDADAKIGLMGFTNAGVSAVTNVGYPDVKGNFQMWRDTCELKEESLPTVTHECDTSGGNSGSPLYDDKNIIHAVHSSGGTPNSATLLEPSIYRWVRSYYESYN